MKGDGGTGTGKPVSIRVDDFLTIQLGDGSAQYEKDGLRQCAAMSRGSEEELLNAELGIVIHDTVFERALNRITA